MAEPKTVVSPLYQDLPMLNIPKNVRHQRGYPPNRLNLRARAQMRKAPRERMLARRLDAWTFI